MESSFQQKLNVKLPENRIFLQLLQPTQTPPAPTTGTNAEVREVAQRVELIDMPPLGRGRSSLSAWTRMRAR